jgi:hypothetical protein
VSVLLTSRPAQRIAVVDDREDERELKGIELQHAGLEPHSISGQFQRVADLVEKIVERADAAVCDHYLQPADYASFYGAELVAALYRRRFPAVLISQFIDQDYDVSIRKWRHWIPVILSKDQADPDQVIRGLDICRREHLGEFIPSRQACRTLVEVVRKSSEAGQTVIDVLVPTWNSRQPVRLPISLIPATLRRKVDIGTRLIAKVNTGAESSADLYFFDFEEAPAPLPEEDFV